MTGLPAAGQARTEITGRFGLRRFAQSAGLLSLTSVASFARAVITAKLFAVTLGPSLVGVLAQIFNFSAFVSVIIPLGLTTGVARMVALKSGDEAGVGRTVATASVLALASAVLAAALLVPAAVPISIGLTGSSRYTIAVILIIASFPLFNLSGVLAYVLQGLADIRRLTTANIASAALAVVTLIPLTLAYGINGAMAAVLVSSVAQAIVFTWSLWRAFAARAWRFVQLRIDKRVARELLEYGGILLMGGIISWGAVLTVRTITLHTVGSSANGMYQVVFGLSTQYITVFMTWMAAYVFPRIVSEAAQGKLGQLLNSGLRANLAIMVPVLVIAVALRDPLIRIFYSSTFLAAGPLIPLQVVGDYARIVGWSFAVCLFAIGRTRSHLAVIASQSIVWVALAALLIPVWGLTAVPVAYSLSYLTYPLLGIALVRHWVGVLPDRWAVMLILVGLLCVVGAYAPMFAGVLLVPIVPVAVYLLNRHELRKA